MHFMQESKADEQDNQLPPEPPTSDDISKLYPVPLTGALFQPPPLPAKHEKKRLFGGLFKRKPKIKHVKKIGEPQPALTSSQMAPAPKAEPVVITAPVVNPPPPHPMPSAPKLPMPTELVPSESKSSVPLIVMPTAAPSSKDSKPPLPPKPDSASPPVNQPSQPPLDLKPGVIIIPNQPRP